MTKVFEQISLFDQPDSDKKSSSPMVSPIPSVSPQLPVTDPRNALDETTISQQAILLLRGLNHNALRQTNLSDKYKLVALLSYEAKMKAGLLSSTQSVRHAYMTVLKGK
jgi:hypothetical protein